MWKIKIYLNSHRTQSLKIVVGNSSYIASTCYPFE